MIEIAEEAPVVLLIKIPCAEFVIKIARVPSALTVRSMPDTALLVVMVMPMPPLADGVIVKPRAVVMPSFMTVK